MIVAAAPLVYDGLRAIQDGWRPIGDEAFVVLRVHDVFTGDTPLLGMPAGVQDYYPPVYGGLASLHLGPGKIIRQPIPLPIDELAECFVVHYSEHRPHQGRDQRPPNATGTGPAVADLASARFRRRTILNGLISEYSQAA